MINKIIHQTFLITSIFLCLVAHAFAGNIDVNNDGHRYAWGENIGWINFKPGYGDGVTMTSTQLIGEAWGENVGWINMNPSYGGVYIDETGKLTGYAWGENIGWISFSCENTSSCTEGVDYGVYINPQTGFFSGKAWGENVGWIVFDYDTSNSYGVKAFWGSCAGDYDSDGDIDGADLQAFIADFENGHVTDNDLLIFKDNFGLTNCSAYAASCSSSQQSASILSAGTESQSLLSGINLLSSHSTNKTLSGSLSIASSSSDNTIQTSETSQSEQTASVDSKVEEVRWTISSGKTGFATGEIDWKIDGFTLNPGNTVLNISVKDSTGFVAGKSIELDYKEIKDETKTTLPEKWTRHFIYEFDFSEDYIRDDTFNIVYLTLFFWPEKITIIDNYTGSVTQEEDSEEDPFQEKWELECNQDSKKVLYLDIPFELIE